MSAVPARLLPVRVVRLAGLATLVYGLLTVAVCAFLVAVGLDLHRRFGIADAYGAPMVLSLIPIALCYGAVLAALGWAGVTASPGTAAAADVLAGGYALIAYAGLSGDDATSVAATVTASLALVTIAAGVVYVVARRMRQVQ